MMPGFQISPTGGMMWHPLEIGIVIAAGICCILYAIAETAAHREIARRRKKRGTKRALPVIWKP